MKNRIWMLLLASLCYGAAQAAQPVTAISSNAGSGAWIGYGDGTVHYCNGGGGTVVAAWTACVQAVKPTGSAVTAIDASGDRAWIGYADGTLYFCHGLGRDKLPEAECTSAQR